MDDWKNASILIYVNCWRPVLWKIIDSLTIDSLQRLNTVNDWTCSVCLEFTDDEIIIVRFARILDDEDVSRRWRIVSTLNKYWCSCRCDSWPLTANCSVIYTSAIVWQANNEATLSLVYIVTSMLNDISTIVHRRHMPPAGSLTTRRLNSCKKVIQRCHQQPWPRKPLQLSLQKTDGSLTVLKLFRNTEEYNGVMSPTDWI